MIRRRQTIEELLAPGIAFNCGYVAGCMDDVASSDGVHWVEPEGLSNPIEPQPPSTRYHNCDADMVYNAEYDAMMAYWNWADDQGGGVGAEVRLRISYDGVHWASP